MSREPFVIRSEVSTQAQFENNKGQSTLNYQVGFGQELQPKSDPKLKGLDTG